MKILILGANGMAGHMIMKYLLSKNFSVSGVNRDQIDFSYKDQIDKLHLNSFDFVLNCVGILVQEANAFPHKALLINSWLPKYLEYMLKDCNTRLVHLSTDCVFDGKKGGYLESDLPNETNMYGTSKSLGEINNQKDVTLRTSIIGPETKKEGTGLMHWFVNKSPDMVDGWENAIWNGITTLQLAKCVEKYFEKPYCGIIHVVEKKNKITKYNLLRKINSIFDLKKTINKVNASKNIDKSLVNSKIKFEIPNYDTQLIELKEFYYNK